MQKIFIEARYKGNVDTENIEVENLPENIGLFSSIQYFNILEDIKDFLKNQGKVVKTFKLAEYEGQVLGCTIKKIEGVDALFYVGDGMFHPIALGIENALPVYIFNPLTEDFFQLPSEKIESFKKKQRAALTSFFSSQNIGLLVSLKEGQLNMTSVELLKEKYPEKNYYIFLFDTLDFSQMENFSFVECFVNTACPRLSYDEQEKFPRPVVEANLILNS